MPFRAYEQACGFDSAIVWDLAGADRETASRGETLTNIPRSWEAQLQDLGAFGPQ
jgi:hypothetical protein